MIGGLPPDRCHTCRDQPLSFPLLNFAADSPEAGQRGQKIQFGAPPTDRIEGIVPVQIGEYSPAQEGLHGVQPNPDLTASHRSQSHAA
jgi:hypothetical protein